MRAVAYTRVSTEHQAREGVSLSAQESRINHYVALNGLELIATIRDKASGKSLNRPGMDSLLNMVESGKVEAVIVYKLDRLSRSTLDTLSLIEMFEGHGIGFHSISEKVDTKSATGRFFLNVVSAVAQMERDLIAERTRDALSHKKAKGEWLGRVPFGFKVESSRLVEDPSEIETIQKAKRLRRAGKSVRAIAATLGVSKSVVHSVININLRTLKAKYVNGLVS